MDLFTVGYRTLLFYFIIILVYRLMGKREVGQLSIIDLIVSILIAELVAISIENFDQSILFSLIPIGVLLVVEITISHLSLRFSILRNVFDGKPSVIIKDGKLNFKEMVNQKYNLDDLLVQLREKSIKSIEEIEFAVLESNGKLSIFKYGVDIKKSSFPMPIILDGEIEKDTLKELNKDEKWVQQLLLKNKVNLEDIFYAFYKGTETYIIKRSDLS